MVETVENIALAGEAIVRIDLCGIAISHDVPDEPEKSPIYIWLKSDSTSDSFGCTNSLSTKIETILGTILGISSSGG